MVPDAAQRGTEWSGALLIRDRRENSVRNGPRKSGLPDLRAFSADLG